MMEVNMGKTARASLTLAAFLVVGVSALAQKQTKQPDPQNQAVPVDTQWTLDAAGTVQRNAIRSVLLLICTRTNMKGTGFLISGGKIVTAAHVVAGCEAADVKGTTPLGQSVQFSHPIVRDEHLDLAVLVPNAALEGGLELGPDANIPLGKQVTTWGFPLIYNGPAPLLSVGYVSGYYGAKIEGRTFKHLVINGALNPGNSGGPVFLAGADKVVGVVIWKEIAFSGQVKEAIKGFHNPRISMGGTFSERQPDGTNKSITDQEVIARVLEEFYTRVQVDIGEAVSVSELRKFLTEHAGELSAAN
jgi:S1-C subfamily serine protease